MSLNIGSASLSPNPVNAGAQFIVSVLICDDEFEFGASYVEDIYQGFGNEEQTIGGKFIGLESGLLTSDDYKLKDSNGNYLLPSNGAQYRLKFTANEVDQFLEVVLNG